MNINLQNRDLLINDLKEELVGPSPQGKEIDCNGDIEFSIKEDSYGPWRQNSNGEEIILRDTPLKRYGVGVIHPFKTDYNSSMEENSSEYTEEEIPFDPLSKKAIQDIESIEKRSERQDNEPDIDDFDLSSANSYQPSSIAITFMAELLEESKVIVEASGGRYTNKKVKVLNDTYDWWLRSPVNLYAEFDSKPILSSENPILLKPSTFRLENNGSLDLNVEIYSRPRKDSPKNIRIITVCLINRTVNSASSNEDCLFQAHFKTHIECNDSTDHIFPYPKPPKDYRDQEEESFNLLYKNLETFAVGHGCAADWGEVRDNKVGWVSAECLPIYETPSITPDIKRDDGTPLEIPMRILAGLEKDNDGFELLNELIELYEKWVENKMAEIINLNREYVDVAKKHLIECANCAERMKDGLDYLKNNNIAMKAFKLANHAILIQQIRYNRNSRLAQYDKNSARIYFSEDYPEITTESSTKGKWRAFQIAFLLMTVRSVGDGETPSRDIAELIWFPTGGGKTEAYLGLTAYSLFIRRLKNKEDNGVDVLMRYTLRLLTAQQFLRASGLICAMEYLRMQHNTDLGNDSFSIGIWLGGSITPNRREEARIVFRKLNRGDRFAENKFIVERCPWCSAQMGPGKFGKLKLIGYKSKDNTVVLHCPDTNCIFSDMLPIYVIDEDIYEARPSMIIGTVDKFAMLAWRPEARSLFGIDSQGNRSYSPPSLIIQDELHLISGPLGSLVGLYETVVEELCIDRRQNKPILPKIVCSTATIRRYQNQILGLYGRRDAFLFPPPGLEFGDSFFSKIATDDKGKPEPGRVYVGVHAPGHGSIQTTQVRSLTTVLQSPMQLPKDKRDPWWTLVVFFNSLRELGTTLTLLQSDIPDYLKTIRYRMGLDYFNVRQIDNLKELTSRLRSDEIPKAISALEKEYSQSKSTPVDICLTSSIMEVGIDIDRLSLMSIIGQPKSTSQYIQVTGRIGRNWKERPGLVLTIYSVSKPRDRSHYEKFRSYHERLYAQVEPTSVTPFSPPVLDRALHALIVSFVRQFESLENISSPYPFPEDPINAIKKLLLERIRHIAPQEEVNFNKIFNRRTEEWKRWKRIKWDGPIKDNDVPLLRDAGSYINPALKELSWPTPRSMRNVDAECQIEISNLYILEDDQDA